MRIGFQGIRGAYSELALYRHFGRSVESVGFGSFEEVFEALADRRVDFGFVPVENTIAGTVVENYDLLLSQECRIIAEAFMKIRHTLLAPHGASIGQIRAAWSHPHALKQCREFLRQHRIEAVPKYDTAGAARMIADENRPDCAAIASELCAEIYGLDILAKDIHSNKTNTTRFLVVARHDNLPEKIVCEKTSLVFITRHYPGALVDCLKIFQKYALNLTKLESRPIPENPWEYVFYTDFDSGTDTGPARNALAELRETARFVKLLGSYPKGS
ncbi:prephenate dehydratase [Desulfonema ishimotonii]|uniref:Prephenate dehydratase n=1 Tax=Desulfonema ishimotonii TaxID=45657 RepID=A0A401FWP2_9BACT|nr:prephenate dehydratase [Desulfonema ishimotonii]GBC61422.1 prephenate dehydratase [Desulfonema ishimotonii]